MRAVLPILLFILLGVSASRVPSQPADKGNDPNGTVAIFSSEILRWVRSGQRSSALDRIIDKHHLPTELQRADWRSFTGERAQAICTVCKAVVKSVIAMWADGTSVEDIQAMLSKLCTRLNLQTEKVCHGLVNINTPIIHYILTSDSSITPDDVCGVALQDKNCATTGPKYEWTVDIDDKPRENDRSPITNQTVEILQISDIHYDPLYEANGNALCDEPTCCRKGQNVTNANQGELAGYWGDYNNCDTPWYAVVDALTQVKKAHPATTYVYFTGDIIDHGIWETTKEGNIESLTKSYNEIKKTFGDTPVYPILGNHEPHPLNLFAPEDIEQTDLSTRWLYKLVSDLWIGYGWLPASTNQTIMKGGYYTVSPKRGFRIIALNNNVCYTYNWWLISHPRDPNDQLRWLADTLLQAELNGEFVHILAHVPPGSNSCHVTWSREYRKIVNRFAHIITGQFNGHTHNDELNIFYDSGDSRKPINVAWNGGSITTYTQLNPNYKVYRANANTFRIEEVETWIYNLTAANKSPSKNPVWYKSYSFKQEYGLSDLSLSSLDRWIRDMAKNSSMLVTYRNNFYKHAVPSLEKECDSTCLYNHLCNIVKLDESDEGKCDELKKA